MVRFFLWTSVTGCATSWEMTLGRSLFRLVFRSVTNNVSLAFLSTLNNKKAPSYISVQGPQMSYKEAKGGLEALKQNNICSCLSISSCSSFTNKTIRTSWCNGPVLCSMWRKLTCMLEQVHRNQRNYSGQIFSLQVPKMRSYHSADRLVC